MDENQCGFFRWIRCYDLVLLNARLFSRKKECYCNRRRSRLCALGLTIAFRFPLEVVVEAVDHLFSVNHRLFITLPTKIARYE